MMTFARFVRFALIFVSLATTIPVAAVAGPADVQTGTASFYDESFQGQKTASGERFDTNALTAAHPSHEPGTRLRVTNLENDRSVEVRVTDHGPTRQNRREGVIIDLSRAAAQKLGFTKDGEARVRVERLDSAKSGG
jgi:rare lipoprotein A